MAQPSSPMDITKAILNGLSVVQLKVTPAKTGATAAIGTVITLAAHGFTEGLPVIFVSGTGFTGIVASTTYYTKYLDATTFALAATVGGAAISLTVAGSAGVFQPVLVFEVPVFEDDPEMEMKPLARPGFDAVVRNAANAMVKRIEKWSFQLDEVKRLPLLFSGALSGRSTGLCTVWIPHYTDTTTVALKSENDFGVTITRDGKLSFADDWAKATIKLESTKPGNVIWTVDGAA